MASLLSFAKSAVQKVENIPQDVNNDVVKPVVNNVIQPVAQHVIQPVARAAIPTAEGIGQSIAQPIVGTARAFSVVPAAIGREIQDKPITDLQQKAFGTTNQGDIAKKIIGNTAQLAGLAYAPGAGLGERTLGEQVAKGALKGAAGNTLFSAGSQLANEGKLNAKGLAESAALGGVLGGGTPLAKAGIEARTPLNETGAVGKNLNAKSGASDQNPEISTGIPRELQSASQLPAKTSSRLPNNASLPKSTPEQPLLSKENKFVGTVKKSDEVSPTVQKQVSGTYKPGSNPEKLAGSQKLVDTGLDKATNKVMGALDQETGKIQPQQISDAIAVAKAHDEAGNFDQATAIYNKLAQHGTAAGQKLQALSLLSNRTPQGLLYSAVKTLKNAGVKTEGKLGDAIKSNVDDIKAAQPGTAEHMLALQKLVDTVNQATPRNLSDATVGIWRAGLLTGPETLAKVATSYGISTPIEAASKPVSAGIDRLLTSSKLSNIMSRNVPGYVKDSRAITFGASDIGAGAKGAVRGAKAIPLKLRTGFDAPDTVGFQHEMGAEAHQTPYERGVLRLHGSTPKIPGAALHDATLNETARTQAMNEGLTGADRTARINELKANPTTAMKATSQLAGDRAANLEDTAFGKGAQALQQFKAGPVPVGKYIAPFSRIPGAIATKGIIDYTPVGVAKGLIQGAYQGLVKGTVDQRALAETLGHGATGTAAAVSLGALLMHNGDMTLSAPTDPKEAALWLAEGKQANSIKVGGKWISLNAFGPAGIAMGLGAGFQRGIESGAGVQGAASQSVASAGKLVASQPYVKGIAGIANAFNNPTEYAQSVYDSTIGSIIPAASSQAASGFDTQARQYPNNVTNTLKSKVPGLREQLPVQKDMFGTTLPGANPSGTIKSGILGTVNPFYPTTPRNQNDPVTNELQRLYTSQGSSGSPSIAKPTSLTIEGHAAKVTPNNLNVLESNAGPVAHATLQTLISSPEYKALPELKGCSWSCYWS